MTDLTIAAPAAPTHTKTPPSPPGGLEPGGAAPLMETVPAVSPASPELTPDSGLLGTLQNQLQDLIAAGGPVILVLGLLSTVALAIVLVKLWQFHRMRLGQLGPVEESLRLWSQSDGKAAIALVAGRSQPVAHLVHLALVGLLRPNVDLATLREELARVANLQLERLRSYLRALEIIGTLSPLLGLLGTVLGMIEAFRQLEAAGAQVDPSILSGGIWQALLTTAVGLTVAIPVVLVHSWLERRVERCSHQMEDAITRVFTRDVGLPRPPAERRQAADSALEVGYAA